jgi:Na+/melibiose symporter-like transporter
MISSYLVFYGTAVLYLPGSLIGFIVALSVLWDAVSDPLMGFISDNTVSRFGKRHLYMAIGTISMAISTYFLWTAKADLSLFSKFTWIFLSVMILKTFITIFITPYNALGAEMTTDYDGRSAIQAMKTVFFLFSILSVTAISMFIFFKPTPEFPVGQLNPLAYRNMAITTSIITLICGIIVHFSTTSYRISGTTGEHMQLSGFFDSVKAAFKCPEYRAVTFGYLFTNLASALIGTIGLHVFTYTFYMNYIHIGIVFGVQFITSIAFQPFWIKISKRYDKKIAILWGLKLSVLGSLILLTLVFYKDLVRAHYAWMLIYSFVVGFSTSGLFSLPHSMITDTVDLEERNHGKRNEGVYFGLLNFSYKISQSLAIFLFGVLLDLIGFDSTLAQQMPSTEIFLGLSLPLGSILSFLLAIIFYKKYSLDRAQLADIQESLKQSHKNNQK